MADALGDRMKAYEALAATRLMSKLPTLARVDGRCFRKFTKGFKKPYDVQMVHAMTATMLQLIRDTHALLGFAYSDEITLVWYYPEPQSQMLFDGKVQKLTSVIAGLATAAFIRDIWAQGEHTARINLMPHFDCRIWQVPNLQEAANVFLWRQDDAVRNSITSAAQTLYSHKELNGKSGADKQEMLFAKGVNWNDYPAFFKRGQFVFPETVERCLTEEERLRIPEAHRPSADERFLRTEMKLRDIDLRKCEDKVEALFGQVLNPREEKP